MNLLPHRYFVIHKPYDMVSQFKSPDKVGLLGDLDFEFPEGIHAIGRLDNNSEGLLILTTNKKVTKLLFQGLVPHKRTYWVMVNKIVSEESVEMLKNGVSIRVGEFEDYNTGPCEVSIIQKPDNLFPYRYTLNERIQYSWLSITIPEGKFHQVRKMVAAIKQQCKRLIRVSIEDLEIGDLAPGAVREIEETDFFKKLKIENWN